MSLPEDKITDVLFKEYDVVAEFYHNAIQERFKLFDWYIKIIPIPITVILGLGAIIDKSEFKIEIPKYYSILGYLFFLLFFCGICLYVVYIKQGNNTSKYAQAMKNLRDSLRDLHPRLESSLVMDYLIPHCDPVHPARRQRPFFKRTRKWINTYTTVKFWRGMIFVIFNSFAFVTAIYFLAADSSTSSISPHTFGIWLFIACIVFHLIIYKSLCVSRYVYSKQ